MYFLFQLNNISLDEDLDKSIGDITKDDKSSQPQVKFASCLITLRTLAKFLGFLVFSPYHHSTDFPAAVKETLISSRNQVCVVLGLRDIDLIRDNVALVTSRSSNGG